MMPNSALTDQTNEESAQDRVTVKSLARNSAYSLVAQVWRIGSRFVMTPLIIAKLGLAGYGTWTLLFVICAYVGVIDVNFGLAYNKFTAEYDAKRDYDRLAQIIGAGMAFVGSIAAVALTGVWLFRAAILHVLGVPEAMIPQAGYALLVVSMCLLMQMSVGCVFPILDGLQRLDLRQKIAILASVIEFIVSIVLLYRGWELLALAVGHFCGQIVSTTVAWRLCRHLCPELRISPFRCSAFGFRNILSLGGRFQFLAVLQLLIHQGTQVFLSALLGVSMLAISEIARKLLSLGAAAGGAVVAPVFPAFSNLYAGGSRQKWEMLYTRGSKIVSMVCLPCFAFLAVFADRLVLLWTGEAFPLAAWTVRMIAPVLFLCSLTGMGTAALRGRGTIRLEVGYGIIGAAILVVLYGPGYWLWGYKGMIGAEVVAGTVSSLWFLMAAARAESLSFISHCRETIFRPALVFAPVAAAAAVFAPALRLPVLFSHPRVNLLVDVTVWGVVFGAVTAACGWFGLLSSSERASLGRHLPGGRNAVVKRALGYAGR